MDAQGLGHVVAELEGIQSPIEATVPASPTRPVGQDHAHALPTDTGEAAGHPGHGPLYLIGKEDRQGRHAAAKESGYGHACQDQAQGIDAPFPGQEKDDGCRSQGARKRPP